MVTKSDWTDEMRAYAKQRWEAGRSASEVANDVNAEFKTTFTRNAAVGILHRLGLKKGTPGRANGSVPVKKRAITKPKTTWQKSPNQFSTAPLQEVELKITEVLNPNTLRTFLDLEEDRCRWPVGNMFCGAPVIAKRKPYCSIHTHNSGDRMRTERLNDRQRTRALTQRRY